MKQNAIIRIVCYSLVFFVLLGIMLTWMDGGAFRFDFDLIPGGNYVSGSGSVDMSEIDNLEIQWVSGSVTVDIKPAGDDTVTFEETGGTEECTMVYEIKGRTLIIRYEKPSVHIGMIYTPSKDLTVTVPGDWLCHELDISVVSADVDVLLMNAGNVELENVSGKVKLNVLETQELHVETVSGAAEVVVDNAREIDCATVSGKLQVYIDKSCDQVDLESVSGDMTVCVFQEMGFEADLSSVSGKVYSDFPTQSSGGKYLHGDGRLKIDAESISGDLKIAEIRYQLTE